MKEQTKPKTFDESLPATAEGLRIYIEEAGKFSKKINKKIEEAQEKLKAITS